MSLRTRLLLSVGGLMAAGLLLTGSLVVGITRASLVDQVDELLRGARAGDLIRPGRGPGPADPTGRRIALLVLDDGGRVVESFPSGFARDPDPLPSLPGAGEPALPAGRIVERPAVDGSLAYRVVAVEVSGLRLVLGASLDQVDAAIAVLVRNLLVIGALVLLALLAAAWLSLRRGLRPLESVTLTADRIAAGDLSRRLGMANDGTEVGRLGGAFDSMLDRIEGAFDEQRRALAQKEVSEDRLRRFVADASHELRTPLTALRGYADLYRSGGLEERPALDAAMARIGAEARRMGLLVDDMLLLARLDQGRPLRREPVDLSALVDEALDEARALEPARPIASSVRPGVAIAGDADRLRQVVANLLVNVRVHTPPETPVEVGLEIDGADCLLTVADHGPGVPAGDAERVFDRFYRAHAGRSRDRGGSGLGLSIAAAIVAAHGGSIEHRPTAGGGATFHVRLPAGDG